MNVPGFVDSWLTELRLPATIVAVVTLWPLLRTVELAKHKRMFAAAFGLLLAYMLLRGFFQPMNAASVAKQIDLMYLAVMTALAATCFGLRGAVVAISVIAIGGLYLPIAIANQFLDPDNNFGLGWGWPGSAITFNRIMFAAGAAMLALALVSSRWRLYMIFTSAVFAAAATASLQKSAQVGIVAAFFVGYFFLLITANWTTIVKTTFACVLAVMLAFPLFGEKLIGRLSLSVDTTGETPIWHVLRGEPSPYGDNYQIAPGSDIHHPIVETPSQFKVNSSYCIFERRADAYNVVDYSCHNGVFSDRSERMTLWVKAVSEFSSSPLVGRGLSTYEAILVGADHLLPNVYRYPHNLLLEVASEGGLIALSLTILAGVLSFVLVSTSEAPLPIRIVASMFMAYMLIAVMFGGDFYDSRMFWLTGVLMAAWRKPEEFA